MANLTPKEMAELDDMLTSSLPAPKPFHASKVQKTLAKLLAAPTNVNLAQDVWGQAHEDAYMLSMFEAGLVEHILVVLCPLSRDSTVSVAQLKDRIAVLGRGKVSVAEMTEKSDLWTALESLEPRLDSAISLRLATLAQNEPRKYVEILFWLIFSISEVGVNNTVRQRMVATPGMTRELCRTVCSSLAWLQANRNTVQELWLLRVQVVTLMAMSKIWSTSGTDAAILMNDEAVSATVLEMAKSSKVASIPSLMLTMPFQLIEAVSTLIVNVGNSGNEAFMAWLARHGIDKAIMTTPISSSRGMMPARMTPMARALISKDSQAHYSHVISMAPLAAVGQRDQIRRKCNHCSKDENPAVPLKVCSKCKKARYCDAKCQTEAWKTHKTSCGNE